MSVSGVQTVTPQSVDPPLAEVAADLGTEQQVQRPVVPLGVVERRKGHEDPRFHEQRGDEPDQPDAVGDAAAWELGKGTGSQPLQRPPVVTGRGRDDRVVRREAWPELAEVGHLDAEAVVLQNVQAARQQPGGNDETPAVVEAVLEDLTMKMR